MAQRGRPRTPVSTAVRSGTELRQWREARGLSQPGLGKLLDVHLQTVYRWEAGISPIPLTVEFALRYLDQH